MKKLHATPAPFAVFCLDILRKKDRVPSLADQRVFVRLWWRRDQAKPRCPIRRGNYDPAFATLVSVIDSNIEPKTVDKEPQASVLVPDEDQHLLQEQIGILAIQSNRRPDLPYG
jgi:hypothetical protein